MEILKKKKSKKPVVRAKKARCISKNILAQKKVQNAFQNIPLKNTKMHCKKISRKDRIAKCTLKNYPHEKKPSAF